MSKFALMSIGVTVITVICFIVFAVFSVIRFVALWRLFKKAGVQPWRLLIPVGAYSYIFELSGFHGLFCLLVLIPFFYIGGIIGWLAPVLLYRRFVGTDQSRAWKTLIPFYGAFLSLKIANDPACQYDGQRFVYKDQEIRLSSFTNQGQNFQQDWNNMQTQWQNNTRGDIGNPQYMAQQSMQNGNVQQGSAQNGYTQQMQGYAHPEQNYGQQVYQHPEQTYFNENTGTSQGFQFTDQTWTENDFRANQ